MIDSEMEKKELGKAPSCTHNKRSLVRTSQVCHRRLAVCERSQQVKEYKHTHTHTHTRLHAHTRTHTYTMAVNLVKAEIREKHSMDIYPIQCKLNN